MALVRTAARLAPRAGAAGALPAPLASLAAAGPCSPVPNHRAHLVFGANTDVGKSVVAAGLVRAAASSSDALHRAAVHYIKPLQCGGSDASFVSRNRPDSDGEHVQSGEGNGTVRCETLFRWETPASPHLASRREDLPVSDDEVLSSLRSSLGRIDDYAGEHEGTAVTIVETAGGALSPSSSSPRNRCATDEFWGWSTQADLYTPLRLPVVFVGDGRLGGISVTLATLEALWARGYRVDAVVFLEEGRERHGADGDSADGDVDIRFGEGNAEALREYLTMHDADGRTSLEGESVLCLPALPPEPIPLDEWYEGTRVAFAGLHHRLGRKDAFFRA